MVATFKKHLIRFRTNIFFKKTSFSGEKEISGFENFLKNFQEDLMTEKNFQETRRMLKVLERRTGESSLTRSSSGNAAEF